MHTAHNPKNIGCCRLLALCMSLEAATAASWASVRTSPKGYGQARYPCQTSKRCGSRSKAAFCTGTHGVVAPLLFALQDFTFTCCHRRWRQFRVRHVQASAASAGGMHTLCLATNGTLYSWGVNDEAALGRPAGGEPWASFKGTMQLSDVPGVVEMPDGASNLTAMSAGDSHSAALDSEGRVYAWGTFRDDAGVMGFSTVHRFAVRPSWPLRRVPLPTNAPACEFAARGRVSLLRGHAPIHNGVDPFSFTRRRHAVAAAARVAAQRCSGAGSRDSFRMRPCCGALRQRRRAHVGLRQAGTAGPRRRAHE